MKKVLAMILFVSMLLALVGCSGRIKMPYNGDIEFHKITLTIPIRFVRDSTKSNADMWVFERGGYAEYILVSRKDFEGDAAASLEKYVEYMKGNGATSAIITFLEGSAVRSQYTKDDLLCQEILFIQGDSVYAVALRGGTADGFKEITDTVQFVAEPAA